MLLLDKLSCQFEQHRFEYSLQLQAGEILAVLGPSGAGKSTLLELIAGFCQAQSGQVSWDNSYFTKLAPNKRPVTTLFQQHNLFNHLSLRQNIAFGLSRSAKLDIKQTQRLEQISTELGIAEQLDKPVSKVSGGQQQRAALARCMLRKHPILLLDEPFSALDPVTRVESLKLIKTYAQRDNLCVILVSHHLSDALHIAQRILFVDQGEIKQDCETAHFLKHPATTNIAEYIQASSVVAANTL